VLARDAFPEMPEVHNSLGAVALQQGDNEAGCRELREAISLKPDYVTPYHNLGRFHRFQAEDTRSLEQLFLSIEMLEKARALDPRKTEVLMDLAIAWVLKGEYPKAKQLFEDVLSVNPMHFKAHQNLVALYRGPLRDAVKAQYHAREAERIEKESLIYGDE
jgi:Flp pilus assembly protein TadD